MAREGTGNRELLIFPLIYSNKLAYLQQRTDLLTETVFLKRLLKPKFQQKL